MIISNSEYDSRIDDTKVAINAYLFSKNGRYKVLSRVFLIKDEVKPFVSDEFKEVDFKGEFIVDHNIITCNPFNPLGKSFSLTFGGGTNLNDDKYCHLSHFVSWEKLEDYENQGKNVISEEFNFS